MYASRFAVLLLFLLSAAHGQTDRCSVCKKPGGTKILLENSGQSSQWREGRMFCTGAVVTLLCSENKELAGPEAFLRTHRSKCTATGWIAWEGGEPFDMKNVECIETSHSANSSATEPPIHDHLSSPATTDLPSTNVSASFSPSPTNRSDAPNVESLSHEEPEWDVEGYDGWYNNYAHPDWGAAEMQLTRKSPPAYSDGVYQMAGKDRPNPIAISEKVFKGATGERSHRYRTVLLTFFGQQVVEEILDAQRPGCPPEYENIPVPPDHPTYKADFMPFLRSRYDMTTGYSPNVPREQLNEITPWIDGNLFYGTTKAWADALRSFSGGELACEDADCLFPRENSIGLPMANPPPPRDHVLKSAKRFNKLGNPRGSENPFVFTFGLLWFREHNTQARNLAEKNPTWNDEKIFNRARQLVIAQHQKIVLYDWLPEFLGVDSIEPYERYDSSVHPGITHEFQSAAMRFGHTLVPPGVVLRNDDCSLIDQLPGDDKIGVRTCNSYWNPQDIFKELEPTKKDKAMEALLFGMATQITEREDNVVTEDLRGQVFGPLEFSRRDLMALNIQRARDHGLPDYNTIRVTYNLPRIDNWTQINEESLRENITYMQEAIEAAKEIYDGDINRLDLWTGGLLETTKQGPGELFQAILLDQFLRIRNGDWYWFENKKNGLFTSEELGIISNATLKDIIVRNTFISPMDIQDNVFINSPDDPSSRCHYDFNVTASMLTNCTEWETYDYFTGSATPYIVVFVLVGLFVVGLFALQYLLSFVRRQSAAQTTAIKRVRSETVSSSTDDIVHSGATQRVVELKSGDGDRPVLVFIRTQPQKEIVLTSDNSQKLRSISLGEATSVTLQQATNDAGFLLVRVPRNHDLLLQFASKDGRETFVRHLKRQLTEASTDVVIDDKRKRRDILASAITKRRRQKVVAKTLKEAFQRAYQAGGNDFADDEDDSEEETVAPTSDEANLALECGLTREEFAESFSSNSRSLFIDQMFRMADTDGDGMVTFRELFNLIVIFTRGGVERKLRLMFDLYDTDKEGRLHREPFKRMFVAMMEMVNASVNDKDLNRLCDSMFQSSGLEKKDYLTFEDFKELMGAHKGALADLNLPGAPGGGGGSGGDAVRARKQKLPSTGSLGSRIRHRLSDMAKSPRRWISTSTEEAPKDDDRSRSPSGKEAAAKSKSALKRDLSLDLEEKEKDDETEIAKSRSVTFSDTRIFHNLQGLAQAYYSPSSTPIKEPPALEESLAECEPSRMISPPVRPDTPDPKTLPRRKSSSALPPRRQSFLERKFRQVTTFIANYKRQIFVIVLYHLVTVCIFAERAYYFSFEREHAGLRRIAGYGVTVTRGAASAMMFTYSSVLLTMCRNVITHLRGTALNEYISFDSFHSFHRHFALTALFYTAVHVLGHAINFYHIATQPADDLTCLFREVFHMSDELPKFQYWLFGTLTGVTAFLITLVTAVIYVFATPYARRHVFNAFWNTHQLYVVFYILMILHGVGRIVQDPLFYLFFIGPLCVFVFDQIISASRAYAELTISKAELLPSGVTHLEIKKPRNFEYKSGQWVRIACLAQGAREFHPFTLTSAPHEETLGLHIRAVGPWTRNLRSTYNDVPYSKIYLDGPFGEGHQDWYKYDVAVMVGGGIGVTPFASILKDIMRKKMTRSVLTCKKIYFMWVTRTQRQFEWMTDIIREVEEQDADRDGVVDVHIFITQFYNKFDLRTTMLYVCERHFQRFYNRSLFTGLRATTHFGRPEFEQFLNEIKGTHLDTKKIGVFSCGPPPMTGSVKSACLQLNEIDGPEFVHHYENF